MMGTTTDLMVVRSNWEISDSFRHHISYAGTLDRELYNRSATYLSPSLAYDILEVHPCRLPDIHRRVRIPYQCQYQQQEPFLRFTRGQILLGCMTGFWGWRQRLR